MEGRYVRVVDVECLQLGKISDKGRNISIPYAMKRTNFEDITYMHQKDPQCQCRGIMSYSRTNEEQFICIWIWRGYDGEKTSFTQSYLLVLERHYVSQMSPRDMRLVKTYLELCQKCPTFLEIVGIETGFEVLVMMNELRRDHDSVVGDN